MCLAVPGEILEITSDDALMPMGRVFFGGIVKEVCLAYVPDSAPGDYVLVHAGFAIARLDKTEAQSVFMTLEGGTATEGKAPA